MAKKRKTTKESSEISDQWVNLAVTELIAGKTEESIIEQLQRNGLTKSAAAKTIKKAREAIAAASQFDKSEEIGKAIARLNNILAWATKAKDPKTALQAQKELNKLFGLYKELENTQGVIRWCGKLRRYGSKYSG